MSECKCDFRGKLLGDGCDVCNPAKALEYARETIADQTDEITTLLAKLAAAEARSERLLGAAMLLRGWLLMENPHACTDSADAALAEGDGR